MKRHFKAPVLWVGMGIFLAACYIVYAGTTNVDSLQLDSSTILDSNGTTRISVGSTNAITGSVTVSSNLTVTGNSTVSGTSVFTLSTSTAPRDSNTSVGITPTAAGQLAYNSTDKEVCVSTGTTRFTWIEVSISSTTTACLH